MAMLNRSTPEFIPDVAAAFSRSLETERRRSGNWPRRSWTNTNQMKRRAQALWPVFGILILGAIFTRGFRKGGVNQ